MCPALTTSARHLDLLHAAFAVCLLAGCSSSASEAEANDTGGRAGAGGDAAAGSSSTAGKSGVAGNGPGGGASAGGASALAGSGSLAGTFNGGSQAGGSGGKGADDAPGTEEHGFNVRKPGAMNLDWMCTFEDESSYVYVRLLQTGTERTGLAETPVYAVELAQISVDSKVSDLANARYDYGGGHHNDALSFDYDGATHTYYHSSFGFGFRSCQPMDCRNVYALGTTTLQTEGCAPARSLPETCVRIEADGTHAVLEDKFVKCQGDST
ncbi:MAG TPA: hypothetical protein VHP33_05305 [Polyangiaceae bacterium]|nr:hypothetical protein [Polyangiaceae bacterium]